MNEVEIKVPKGLSKEARQLWADVHTEFHVETAPARLLLLTACHALDRLRSAQKELKRDGITSANRFGQRVAHPALAVERTARTALMGALKQIGFSGGVE